MSNEHEPSLREKLKPAEYLLFAGIAGVFTALVVLMSTRDWLLVAIFGLAAFIFCLLVTATLMLSVPKKPGDTPEDSEAH